MYRLVAVVAVGACATTTRLCPPGAQLATEERPTGRVEWCGTTVAGITALPVEGRTLTGLFDVAHPSPASGGLEGPYTHWYPDGALESHGEYVEVGDKSVPNGLWAFWHPDGQLASIGRYERGKPVGCFEAWDERGTGTTGVVDGDRLRVQPCDPPSAAGLAEVETRSHPRDRRGVWGDLSLHTLAQSGTFGEANSTQRDSDPTPTIAIVAGAGIEGAPTYTTQQPVEYLLGSPMPETWTLGGLAYGLDLALRLQMR